MDDSFKRYIGNNGKILKTNIHLADNEAALLHDDLGGSLGVDAEAAGV